MAYLQKETSLLTTGLEDHFGTFLKLKFLKVSKVSKSPLNAVYFFSKVMHTRFLKDAFKLETPFG
jgi:hypothetical protein